MNKKLRYFIYCRKSSEEASEQIMSLPAQEAELLRYAGIRNLDVVEVLKEAQTAFKKGRPIFSEMLRRISNGEANAVLSWQPNRIARNSSDGGEFITLMDENKLLELCTPGKSYSNSSDDKFILNIEFSMAKKDSDDKSENVKRGNRHKFFEKGQWIGMAKPGYVNLLHPATKEKYIGVDLDRFNLIDKAIRLILSGSKTPMEALNTLNVEWGYRTRKTRILGNKPLSKSAFYKLLADPYYMGKMIRSEGETMGSHKPMLTEEEFNKLQVILGRKGRPHFTSHNFPYKNLLRCGECGGSITCEEKWQIICPKCKLKFHKGKLTEQCPGCSTFIEEMKNPKLLNYVYYHCTKRVHKNCSQGSITREKLEEQADTLLSKFEISENLKTWAIKHLNELHDFEVQDREKIHQNLLRAKADCISRLDNLVKLKISVGNTDGKVLSDDEYNRQRESIQSERESIERQLGQIDERVDRWHELSVKTFEFACYARYQFKHGDVMAKTRIFKALGSNLTILNKKLLVDGEKSWFLIEKGKQKILKDMSALEPNKKIDISVISSLPEPVRQAWLPD